MRKKVAIIISLVLVVAIMLVFKVSYKMNTNDNLVKSKYDISKRINELDIQNNKEYREYLKDISVYIKPKQLIDYINYNGFDFPSKNLKNAARNGEDMILALKKNAYENVLVLLIQKNQDWSNLPLTENFRKKFNEGGGVINEIDTRHIVHNIKDYSDIDNESTIEYINTTQLQDFNFDNKIFSVQYDYIPDDAYEKYSEYNIYYMLYYGAGAYNSDRYNYQFVLDDKGYLDDIIFLGKTPVIVEGRDLEHPKNNEWHDGDE